MLHRSPTSRSEADLPSHAVPDEELQEGAAPDAPCGASCHEKRRLSLVCHRGLPAQGWVPVDTQVHVHTGAEFLSSSSHLSRMLFILSSMISQPSPPIVPAVGP